MTKNVIQKRILTTFLASITIWSNICWANSNKSAAEQLFPYGEWVSLSSLPNIPQDLKNIRLMRLRPEEDPIDRNRWAEVTSSFYIDRHTVEKEVLNAFVGPNDPPPINYTFWKKAILTMEGEKYVSFPTRHSVSCLGKTIDGVNIPPETNGEIIYNFFCHSADALSWKTEAQRAKENAEAEKRKTQQQAFEQTQQTLIQQRKAQTVQGFQNALFQGAGLLQMFGRR